MPLGKDPRYKSIGSLIKAGEIASIKDIFQMIPMTLVRDDSGLHYSTLHKKVFTPGSFKLDEFIILAELFGVTPHDFVTIAMNDIKRKPKATAKKN